MSQTTKKIQLHLKRKRKNEDLKTEPDLPSLDAREREQQDLLDGVNLNQLERERPFTSPKRERVEDASPIKIAYYASREDGSEVYARNSEGEFPIDIDGNQVYAKVKAKFGDVEHEVEVPPVLEDGSVRYIHKDGIVYPMNLTTKRPIFKPGKLGSEEYLTDNVFPEPHYPLDSDGKTYYAKTYQKDEYPIKKNDRYIYAKDKDEKEIYPKDCKGNEYVIVNDKTPTYAKEANRDEYYPQKFDELEVNTFDTIMNYLSDANKS